MKKFIALFYIFQFISNQTFAEELIRIPALFIHYFEHEEKDHHHEFGEFIAEHYGDHHDVNHHSRDNSDHNHDHLPFRHNNDCDVHFSITFFLTNDIPSPIFSFDEINVAPFVCLSNFLKSQYQRQIWQPPKLS